MPVTGRKPKPQGQARHRVQPAHDWTEVVNVPFDGRGLPERRSDGRDWPARTKDKWESWRVMPHCRLWSSATWDFALDSIEVAALFHEKGDTKYATELRNRERVLGTTPDYLRDLRIRYVDLQPENDEAAEVANIADYLKL